MPQGSSRKTTTWLATLCSTTSTQWVESPTMTAFWSVKSRKILSSSACGEFKFLTWRLLIVYIFSEKTCIEESYQASKEVNVEMMRYFREDQLIVFRAAILLAFVGPYLRGIFHDCRLLPWVLCLNFTEAQLLMSLPIVCCYGPNNSGKSDRLLVYSACCGVRNGKNKSEF